MAETIRDRLAASGVLGSVIIPPETDLMLGALEIVEAQAPDPAGITLGRVSLVHDLSKNPIPGFDFAMALPAPGITIPFKLKLEPTVAPTAFKCWLQLADEDHPLVAFDFVKSVPGFALTGATRIAAADGTVTLKAIAAGQPGSRPRLVSRSPEAGAALGPALLIAGAAASPAAIRFTPDNDSTEGIVTLGLEPSSVVFGASEVGFDCPAIIIDDSDAAAGPGAGAPGLDPPKPSITADTPSWRGILARDLEFFLPPSVPLFSGQPIRGYLEVPRGAGGVQLVVNTKVPARPAAAGRSGRPAFSIRIECLDPTATGLSGLVPTLISATMELPLDGAGAGFTTEHDRAKEITFGAGKPVRATATLSRDPINSPGQFKVIVAVAAQGADGLVSVESHGTDGAKIFNTAAALATALLADRNVARDVKVGDTAGVALAGMLVVGEALSSLFQDESQFVLHGVEIESSGDGAPVGRALVLTLDYTVAVRVTQVDVGVMSVGMDPDRPMRIRVRNARMALNFTKSGLSMVDLDFDRSTMEVEDPGAWKVGGLESLFEVLRSRSGRGSSWIEVDLGFKLNLGPVNVSGATIRATLQPSGAIDVAIRGLAAAIDIPGAITGKGALRLIEPGGFAANLAVGIVPLALNADGSVAHNDQMTVLGLDVDLPAPIPLANSGFGLLGLGGTLGFSARANYASTGASDPIAQQLLWDPKAPTAFTGAPGQFTFGLRAAVGTLPDLGFTFSAKAGLFVTAPDIAIRGSLNGRVLAPPVKMTDPPWPPEPGISFLGFIAVDASALSFGVFGQVNLKPLLDIHVPLAGQFPFGPGASNWYLYLGADGAPIEGRSIGPVSVTVLPGIIDARADAYLMVRGHGITDWPFGHRILSVSDGLVVAFGFNVQSTYGVKPIVWAELYVGLDVLLGSKPKILAGFGRAGGSLNLGPFSLGVQAQVKFLVAADTTYFWAEVTGRIELFFFDIEGTVTISFGDHEPALALAPPDRHPLDRVNEQGAPVGPLGTLTDDRYAVIAPLAEDPVLAATVWPDAYISLPFASAPAINAATAGAQFPGVVGPGAPAPAKPVGTEMLHYTWRLESVALRDVTDEADKHAGVGTAPPGQLAARWQVPRSGAGGSDIDELLLCSTGPDVWVNRLLDGGAGLPGGDPLAQAADICNVTIPEPAPGWAIGFLAAQDVSGFRLPADPVSPNPRVSRVEARFHHHGIVPVTAFVGPGMSEVLLDNINAVSSPYTLDPAALVAWPSSADIEHTFAGHLRSPNLRWLPDVPAAVLAESSEFVAQLVQLALEEPIVAGEVLLVVDPALVENPDRSIVTGFSVRDDTGARWTDARPVQIPTGEVAFLFSVPHADAVSGIGVTFPLGVELGVVGVGGVTVSARDLAARERVLIAREADRRSAAAAGGPPTQPHGVGPHQRAILEPGRLYRIDVDMTWSGQIARQNEAGQTEVTGRVDFGDPASTTYADGRSTLRQYFFRTAPVASAPAPGPWTPGFIAWLVGEQRVFRAEMLERHLGGYEPAQSEEFRFCDDPIRAHFAQDHVPALARTYGYELEAAVRRVDRPGPEHQNPTLHQLLWTFLTDPGFLGPVDRRRYDAALASACATPTPGSTGTVDRPGLASEAWYEAFVHAKPLGGGPDGALRGVTFRTSRWRDPGDMFAGIGIGTLGHVAADVMRGDLEITDPSALSPAVVDGDDAAFARALVALGLEGWPPTDEPRISRLWVAAIGNSWRFAGLLIELPEPIHRPGRLDVIGLSGTVVDAGAASFGIRRRDRIGARLLYLTATPFRILRPGELAIQQPGDDPDNPFALPPAAGPGSGSLVPVIALTATSTRSGFGQTIAATLDLPTLPSFAGDPR